MPSSIATTPPCLRAGIFRYRARAKFSGVEASASWTLAEGLTLEGFVTDLEAKDATGSQLPYRPDTTAQVSARFSSDKTHWLLLARYTGDRGDGFGTVLEEYTVMDSSFRYTITEDLSISVRAENLTNKAYSDIVGYRSAGRTLYLGLNVSL